MRRFSFLYLIALTSLVLFGLSGCLSVSSSPNAKFYMLEPMEKDQVSGEFNIPSGVIIGVGPAEIPEYLDRPQIVTKNRDGTLSIAQFDRWGESLDLGLVRLVDENLSLILPGVPLEMFPWNLNIDVRYQVIISVVKLESRLNKDLNLVVQWSLIDLKKKELAFSKRSEFLEPIQPHNYAGLTRALSVSCASLSTEIAHGLSTVANRPEKKDENGNT